MTATFSPRPAPRRSNAPYVTLCVAIIVGALVSVLLLNTTMAAGAYEARDLKIEIAGLQQQRADLLTQLDANAAPQNLAARATELGMARANQVGFISLLDGTLIPAGGAG